MPGSERIEGGSDEPIKLSLPPASGSLRGKGTFFWQPVPQPGAFLCPFDRYLLRVNPSILEVSASDVYRIDHVSQFVMDLGSANFVPTLRFLHPKKPGDDNHELILQRPPILRLLASSF